MRAHTVPTATCNVAFGDQVVDGKSEVWKCGAIRRRPLFSASGPRPKSGVEESWFLRFSEKSSSATDKLPFVQTSSQEMFLLPEFRCASAELAPIDTEPRWLDSSGETEVKVNAWLTDRPPECQGPCCCRNRSARSSFLFVVLHQREDIEAGQFVATIQEAQLHCECCAIYCSA